MEKKRLSKKPEENKTCKPSVLKIANDLRNNTENEGVKTDLLVQKLIASLDFTEGDVTALYKNTVGQSNNSEWTEQRKGPLTASKFKSVYTRDKTLEKDPKQDPSSVLSSILSYKSLKPIWQMKHGISTEIHVKTRYISIMKKDRHINFTSLDPGMTAMKDYPFISVSTDLDLCCDCCGQWYAEFKCPGSIKDQIPSADNLPCLELRNGETKLKTNSEYYFQVQGQMGVTGRTYTDFLYLLSKDFIRKGYNMTVTFSQIYVLEKLVWFWQKYVGPELINHSLKHRLEEQKTREEEENANLPRKVIRESSSKTIVLVSKRVSSNVKVVKKKPFSSKGKAKPGKKLS